MKILNPVKAIRQNCLECCNGSAFEVRKCVIKSCDLYPFRFGKNPYRTKRVYSDDEKSALAKRLRLGRESKAGALAQ